MSDELFGLLMFGAFIVAVVAVVVYESCCYYSFRRQIRELQRSAKRIMTEIDQNYR